MTNDSGIQEAEQMGDFTRETLSVVMAALYQAYIYNVAVPEHGRFRGIINKVLILYVLHLA